MKLFVACLLGVVASSSAQSQEKSISVEMEFSRRALSIHYQVPAVGVGTVEFGTSPWAGIEDFHRNVYFVEARNSQGELLEVVYRPDGSWQIKTEGRPFVFSYSIIHQKESSTAGRNGHHHPTLFDEWAFLFGNSYLLKPTSPRLKSLPVRVSINPGPYGDAWPSWKDGQEIEGFDWFADSLLIAGDFRVKQIELDRTKVRIAMQGDWQFKDEAFVKAIDKIVRAQIRYTKTLPKTDILIALVPGSANSNGGSVVGGAIGLYPSPEEDLTADGSKSLHLVAHEHFHLWIGQILQPAPGTEEDYYKWLHEGCTDYYALLTLYREGLTSDRMFVQSLNDQLVELARNPYAKTATAKILAESYWNNNDYNRLPYVKGGLVSLLIDLRIRKSTGNEKNIDDFIQGLIAATRTEGRGYDREMIVEVLNDVSESDEDFSWADFVDRYTVEADPIPCDDILHSCGIATKRKEIPLFDLGFEVEEGQIRKGSKVAKVSQLSNAADAGIKVGDVIEGSSIYFGNTEEQAAFNIRREGEQLDVSFLPVRRMSVLQIDNSSENQRRCQILKTARGAAEQLTDE